MTTSNQTTSTNGKSTTPVSTAADADARIEAAADADAARRTREQAVSVALTKQEQAAALEPLPLVTHPSGVQVPEQGARSMRAVDSARKVSSVTQEQLARASVRTLTKYFDMALQECVPELAALAARSKRK